MRIREGDPLEIYTDREGEVISRQDGQLILRAYEDTCLLCGGTENLRFLHGKAVCHRCVDELNNRG